MLNKSQDIIPVAVIVITAFFLILIPFRIVGYGYLPLDDAMRHAAKVISGKDWNQILVLRDGIGMDSHPGWHAVLGAVRRVTGWEAHGLVLFSVVSLSCLFLLVPILFLRRPEAWLASMATLAVFSSYFFFRLFLGRPYILTMAVILAMCLWWPDIRKKKISSRALAALVLMIAASTWIHCSWYLFILPIAALILAREWRSASVFTICAAAGIAIGASFTGHPVLFLKQTLTHLFLAFGSCDAENMLVGEFRPALGDTNIVIVAAAISGWMALRGRLKRGVIDNPVFILAALCFFLGLVSRRVWIDWGIPAIVAWMAIYYQEFIESGMGGLAWRRVVLTAISGAVLYLCVTSDVGSRWSSFKPLDYVSKDDPAQAEWLPGKGGVIYSDDMRFFYTIFYRNPHGDWRYILGFEPGLMPPEDLKILRDIQRNARTFKMFDGWVRKMRPEDRLILFGPSYGKPNIPALEWNYVAINTWIGRLPRNQEKKGSDPSDGQ